MKFERAAKASLSAKETPTYGIHILKAWMIFFQILAHAHIWAVQSHSFFTDPHLDPFWIKVAMSFGCFGMVVPMTAGAVLRMISATDKEGRVVNIDWRSMIVTMALLALFESTKEALTYDLSTFFMWNVLHLVAVTFLLTLFIAQYGMKWLWSAALTILFIAPFMIDILDPIETRLTQTLVVPSWPLMGVAFAVALTIVAALAGFMLNRSRSFAPKHKKRMLAVLGVVWLVMTAVFLNLRTGPFALASLKTLGIGPLVGTHSGIHIWGFFPWAGTIMLGFLIYDVIARTKAKPAVMAGIFVCGLILLAVFYRNYAPAVDAILAASKSSVLSGAYMNRYPAMAMLIIGLFCTAAPIAYVLMRLGLERGYVIDLSRCILWIYIYQTTILVGVPRYFTQWLPPEEGAMAYVVFALVSSLALPLILKRLPFRIHLQLRKQAAEV